MKKLVIPIIFLLSIMGCSKAPFDIPEEELPKEISFIVEAVDEKGDEIIGAEILLDTVKIGETPFQGNVSRGSHVILVRKPGFKVYRNRFIVTTESSITEYAVLEKIEADDEESEILKVILMFLRTQIF